MKQATLCLLVRGDEVLLAMKKRGFGMGKWNGVGGKPNPGESLEAAAVRETEEEIGVHISVVERMAVLEFVFPNKSEWDQQVVVYLVRKWQGEPVETEEMAPKWFSKPRLPFNQMWWDDEIWLPKVLAGKKLEARFVMREDDTPGEYSIKEINGAG